MPRSVSIRASLRGFVSLAPSRVDHIPAFRIALGLAIPLAILLVTENITWAMYAGFGAFTGIYSRYEPTAMRLRRQVLIGALLTLCVTLGATLAQLGESISEAASSWLALVVAAVVAGAAATLVTARGIRPGGAVFPLFAVAAVAAAPPAAPIWVAALVAGLSATGCVLLGLLGHWAGERHPAAGPAPGRQVFTRSQLAAEFSRYAGAALVAGVLGLASGLPFPYWAQIAAVVPLSAPGRPAQVERGLHRVAGSALGIVTTGFLLSFPAEAWQLVVWVVVLQFLAEMYVLRNYALALLFITPLALLMVQLANPQPVGPMLQARVLETAIGVVVGIGFVIASALFDRWIAARRAQLRQQARQRMQERRADPGSAGEPTPR